MIDIREAVTERLRGDPTITSYVGDRVYRSVAQQGFIKPFIVWELQEERFPNWLTGGGSITQADFEIALFDTDSDRLSLLLGVVKESLATWRGITGSVSVRRCLIVATSDDYIAPTDASEDGVYSTSIDVTIQYLSDQYDVDVS